MSIPDDGSASMHGALTALLDSVKGSRNVFRHLTVVEQALKHLDGGGNFLFELTSDQLAEMRRQLSGLLGAKPARGLVELRNVIDEAIKKRKRADARAPLSSFFVDHKLEVSEGARTDFDRLFADWATAPPPRR